jgi:ABC-type dipeptide/oligopeptide/nickel transport system ATPase component
MKDGKILEAGPSEAIYQGTKEEYTRELIATIPRDNLDHIRSRQRDREVAEAERMANA